MIIDPNDLTTYTPMHLDEFAAWAHAIEATEGVEILADTSGVSHQHVQRDAPHGMNHEHEMVVEFATGGAVRSGQAARVGEHGPEAVIDPRNIVDG
jgi:hypothetical protein